VTHAGDNVADRHVAALETPRTMLSARYVRVLVWVQVLPPSARC
jgi:hypothetical protein